MVVVEGFKLLFTMVFANTNLFVFVTLNIVRDQFELVVFAKGLTMEFALLLIRPLQSVSVVLLVSHSVSS